MAAATDLKLGRPLLTNAPEPSPAPAASTPAEAPRPSVAESLAATYERIQEREGNAPGQRAPDGKFQPRTAPVAAAPGTTDPDQPSTQGNEPPPESGS